MIYLKAAFLTVATIILLVLLGFLIVGVFVWIGNNIAVSVAILIGLMIFWVFFTIFTEWLKMLIQNEEKY